MKDRAVAPTPEVDMTRADPTRAVNYLLGGKDHYDVDRAATDAAMIELPLLPKMARAHVQFRRRVVRQLAVAAGIRQFLHFDCGFPHALDLHEIAQQVDPAARIVYVAPDPVVAAHLRALLSSDPRGVVLCVHPQAGRLSAVLDDPELAQTLDLNRPLAVTLSSTLMSLSDREALCELDRLRAATAAGSHIALSQLTADADPDAIAYTVKDLRDRGFPHPARTREQLTALFAGWDIVDPGVVSILDWHPSARDLTLVGHDGSHEHTVHILGGLARNPGGPQ